jgi:hypothetical protein
MTNNSQHVYLDPPTDEGDDETTIIFASNMNRVVEPAYTNMEENQGSNNLTNIITGIIKAMRQIPDNHYVWKYRNPTRTYYVMGLDEDQHGDNPFELLLRPQTHKTLHQFIDWYEQQLMVAYELRQTIPPIHTQDLLESPVISKDAHSSNSALESSSSEPITWGNRQVRDHAEELRQWQETPTRETLTKKEQSKVPFLEDANDNTQYDRPATSTFLRFYSTEPDYLNTNTPQVTPGNATERSTDHDKRPTNDAREEREDEQEFSRIPIAGENSEDYHGDCWDTDSDDDKAHAGDDHNKFTTNMTRIIPHPNPTCETSSLDDSDDDIWWSDLAKFNDEDNSENGEDHGLPSLPNNPFPIVEPLPYSYAHALTGVPMTASMTPNWTRRRDRSNSSLDTDTHPREPIPQTE